MSASTTKPPSSSSRDDNNALHLETGGSIRIAPTATNSVDSTEQSVPEWLRGSSSRNANYRPQEHRYLEESGLSANSGSPREVFVPDDDDAEAPSSPRSHGRLMALLKSRRARVTLTIVACLAAAAAVVFVVTQSNDSSPAVRVVEPGAGATLVDTRAPAQTTSPPSQAPAVMLPPPDATTSPVAMAVVEPDATKEESNPSGADAEANALACGNGTAEFEFLELEDATTLVLRYSAVDRLCMLVQTDGNTTWVPVARSYAGRPWEPYMLHGHTASTVGIDCSSSNYCSVPVPPIATTTPAPQSLFGAKTSNPPLLRYALASRSYQLSDRDTLARFLEQTTFGTTRRELHAVELTLQEKRQNATSSGADNVVTTVMAEWIRDQMARVKPSLHREFWRRHAVARFEATSLVGHVTHPCQRGAAYRKFALTEKHIGHFLEIETVSSGSNNDTKLLKMDNVVLTVVTGPIVLHDHPTKPLLEFEDGSYKICRHPKPSVGGDVFLQHPLDDTKCKRTVQFGTTSGNPPISFPDDVNPMLEVDLPDASIAPIDADVYADKDPPLQRIVTTQALVGDLCETTEYKPPGGPVPIVFGRIASGDYWVHDPRFVLQENTPANPLVDGGGIVVYQSAHPDNRNYGAKCANVPRTFVNYDSCVLTRHPHVCGPSRIDRVLQVDLDESTIKSFYNLTKEDSFSSGQEGEEESTRYVYAVGGLRIEDDKEAPAPCHPLARSRWIVDDGNCTEANAQLGPNTVSVLSYLLSHFGDTVGSPPYTIRDIGFPARSSTHCDENDFQRKGMQILLDDGTCWRNVHPDLYQVYDMTVWLQLHPGGPGPIARWAENDSALLIFPGHHEMWRWRDNKKLFFNIGRLGQTVDFSDLSSELQASPNVFEHLSGGEAVVTGGDALVCGSPGEVANDLMLGGEAFRGAFDIFTPQNFTAVDRDGDQEIVWAQVALTAADQLRQRTAWALSQIMVINAATNGDKGIEDFVNYYDIFVRHAFGSYGRILKEVAHSSLMAVMLTYRQLKSTGYSWRKNVGVLEHPDENFAREIMQLFTIGLYALNEDGTRKLDSNGKTIRTYTNDDVMEYARVWTGFRERAKRGNKDDANDNNMDPMYIHVEWRDVFPKLGLDNQYIGDSYPLCIDLPKQHFLKPGAQYRILGSNPLPELLADDGKWATDPLADWLTATPNGGLDGALCAPVDGTCTYPSVVTLPANITCSGVGECSVDSIRSVRVTGGVFYEYVRPPCVYQAFFSHPQTVKTSNPRLSATAFHCADPRTEVASTACCLNGSAEANRVEAYWGERVRAATAESRCNDHALEMCTANGKLDLQNCGGNPCRHRPFYWMANESPCEIKAKIEPISGKVAVVHKVPNEEASGKEKILELQDEDNKSFFRVHYLSDSSDRIPAFSLQCASNPLCSISEDGYCMCDMIVTEEQVFDSPPTREEVLSSLSIGSFPLDMIERQFDTSMTDDNVTVHTDVNLNGGYSEDTVFEVVDDFGRVHLRKNVRSVVTIAGTDISFRNPVHFMSLTEPTERDADYETGAALDHYIYHENTAPFVSIRLAQRFGISNPSPPYIAKMARAFRTGMFNFTVDDETVLSFGGGSHGDLGATIAAALLDDEARSVLLEKDPTYGALKEPLVKVMNVLRNLDFQPTPEYPFLRFLPDMVERIGQMVYHAPSIFSFFLPEYQPNGIIADAGQVSPEALVHSSPNIIFSMNGLLSLIKYGFDRCFGGFGYSRNWEGSAACEWRIPGVFTNASMYPSFDALNMSSTRAFVDELATVMTSGRLSVHHREVIADVAENQTDLKAATIMAEQLIVATSEFHSSGTVNKSGTPRTVQEKLPPSHRPYKALVVLLLSGGCDSYNMIVPHTCNTTNEAGLTILEQYIAERGDIGLTESERSETIDVEGQPCDRFAIHPKFPIIKDLYEQGDLSFFMNVGVLEQPVTKEDYARKTATQLFAHNEQQDQIQRIDPFTKVPRTGILGRLVDVLNSDEYGYRAQSISLDEAFTAVKNDNPQSSLIIGSRGPRPFNPKPESEDDDLRDYLTLLNDNNEVSSSLFGEAWSDLFLRSVVEGEFLSDLLANVTLHDPCKSAAFNMFLQLIQARKQRGSDRDVIILRLTGYDNHSKMKTNLESRFRGLNTALECYRENVKAMGLWEDVSLLIVSEFGRTLTPNTNQGSDHAWAGNYFAMGGAVKGGRTFGEYPSDLTDDGPLNVGRGRLIPTMSWESVWSCVIEWLGIEAKDFDYILPNAKQANTTLLRRDDVFESNFPSGSPSFSSFPSSLPSSSEPSLAIPDNSP